LDDERDYRLITVRPLAPALGAEVGGVDIAALDDDAWAEIDHAFQRHMVLFFPDQDLTPAQQVAFAARFGPVGRYPFADPIPEHPDVIAIVKEAEQTSNFGGMWHTDTTYLERPSAGSVLYARQTPAVGGDTLWANMSLAYETLSDGLRRLLDGLQSVNSAAKNKASLREDHLATGTMEGRDTERQDELGAVHPVVRTHPVTGRKSLYISPAHTVRFDGMTEAESAPLLDFLFAHAVKEDFTCRFHWRPGSLAVWDNRCTWHYPLNDYHGHRREMHRVTIDGERPA